MKKLCTALVVAAVALSALAAALSGAAGPAPPRQAGARGRLSGSAGQR